MAKKKSGAPLSIQPPGEHKELIRRMAKLGASKADCTRLKELVNQAFRARNLRSMLGDTTGEVVVPADKEEEARFLLNWKAGIAHDLVVPLVCILGWAAVLEKIFLPVFPRLEA